MQNFWVSVSYDRELVLSNCFTTTSREEAVACMMTYLQLEFDLPASTPVKVAHQ
ncbi:MAG: hypothetical protein VKQ33_01715 [Candidatus Sericytochromatia bacterium]|nr:hypothetical protein [Candidatus Sericytochromatia bacterium]